MLKHCIAVLFLLPSIASAECGFYRTDDTMTIVVSKKSNTCFSNGSFKEAFKSDLQASLRVANYVPPQKKSPDLRLAKSARQIDPQQSGKPQTLASADYYGQKR